MGALHEKGEGDPSFGSVLLATVAGFFILDRHQYGSLGAAGAVASATVLSLTSVMP